MKIVKATKKYEAWLGRATPLVKADLELKHRLMAEATFPFLRATFYRWCQLWPEVCPELSRAPKVLAVGDLHVENFGTWRDVEGRLVWGVNDFDEVCPMPYTIDLVRLAASAMLAAASERLKLSRRTVCDAILSGYADSLESGGRPIVLGEHHHWLREIATGELRDPARFWEKMAALPAWKKRVPAGAVKGLERMMPDKGIAYRICHRVAGLGSLGRERFVALADWDGGKIAREAKALVPSAYLWAANGTPRAEINYQNVLNQSVRCCDPFVRLKGRWIVRRLAPDCSRVELAHLPKEHDGRRLLREMGWETANVHLGTRRAAQLILPGLKRLRANWLANAAESMVEATIEDWEQWKKHASLSKRSAVE